MTDLPKSAPNLFVVKEVIQTASASSDFLGRLTDFLCANLGVEPDYYDYSNVELRPPMSKEVLLGPLTRFERDAVAVYEIVRRDAFLLHNDIQAKKLFYSSKAFESSTERVSFEQLSADFDKLNAKMLGEYAHTQGCYDLASGAMFAAYSWSIRSKYSLFNPASKLKIREGFVAYHLLDE